MTPEQFFRVMEATWPAARSWRAGPWRIRDGQDGGQRVSAITAEGEWSAEDIALAEAEAAQLGQPALFLIPPGEAALDAALAARGYRVHDPVLAYAAPLDLLLHPYNPMTAFPHWPPLAVTADLWADGDIGPSRLQVMARAQSPKCAILARTGDTPSGAAFVSLSEGIAVLHALVIGPRWRRKGAARQVMFAAAHWAQGQGATTLAVVVTEANTAARGLYEALGMQVVARYHYRLK